MGCGIPVCGNHTDYVDGDSFFQPASLEEKWRNRRKRKNFRGASSDAEADCPYSGAKEVMLCFFCYCAIEQTTILWASSYLRLYKAYPPGRLPDLQAFSLSELRLEER